MIPKVPYLIKELQYPWDARWIIRAPPPLQKIPTRCFYRASGIRNFEKESQNIFKRRVWYWSCSLGCYKLQSTTIIIRLANHLISMKVIYVSAISVQSEPPSLNLQRTKWIPRIQFILKISSIMLGLSPCLKTGG